MDKIKNITTKVKNAYKCIKYTQITKKRKNKAKPKITINHEGIPNWFERGSGINY